MKEKIIVNFEMLSLDEVISMGRSIESGKFTFFTEKSTQASIPSGIFPVLRTNEFYQEVLADKDAYFNCIHLCFNSFTGQKIKIPVIIFGASLKNKIHFPILIGSILTSLMMLQLTEFSTFLISSDKEEEHSRWNNFIRIKRNLLERIFTFYKNMDSEINSLMTWPIRGEGSTTRKIAEQTRFQRVELTAFNVELYSDKTLNDDAISYINDCMGRWVKFAPNTPEIDNKSNATEDFILKTKTFLKILGDTNKLTPVK